MKDQQTLILDSNKIEKIVKRIAFQIYENNAVETDLFIAGIWDRGYHLAEMMARELTEISPIKTHLLRIDIDKQDPVSSEVKMDKPVTTVENQRVILVDDVLNTGRTLFYALEPFMNISLQKLEIAVLVNRSHACFGVYPQYTGYELATTLEEHIHVSFEEEPKGVFLR
ncbi:phosphoribosyltransferase family protein [Roseivirga sp. BDSF3-8]|uniref:phosphoribosyltransferase family protein n=1 Tax=Roseivirga sp. BDSF3-8 TaxID=3241598 RepID=UPI0035326734